MYFKFCHYSCQSVQNLGLAVVTLVAGMIVDSSGGSHFYLQLFFMLFLLSK